MAQSIDLLVLAVSRVKKGVMLAGMSTEPDPMTGRKWVQITRPDGALQVGDITLEGGALMQPGNVVRITDLTAAPEPPFVERWQMGAETTSALLRHISPERHVKFFPDHLDKDPAAVLERQERSLCLVKPSEIHALFEMEEKRFKSYMLLELGELGSFEMPVTDLSWRALGRRWLVEERAGEMDLDAEDIRARVGEAYVVVGLHTNRTPLVIGVHTSPPYSATITPSQL
ncbi:MAG TPA: hypothetical protein VGE07_28300 [Herpetosiphonaceae bacterium]